MLRYVFWVALTVLVVIGLGRLKRWLLRTAENLGKCDCLPEIPVNNKGKDSAQGDDYEKSGGGLSGLSAAADQ